MNINQALKWSSQKLATSPTSSLDAEVLLSWVLNKPKEWLRVHNDEKLSWFKLFKFKKAIKKRSRDFPVAYITGHKEFFGLNFKVNRHTLVPRPESEQLVARAKQITYDNPINIIDVGTGSGCIAISLAKSLPNSIISASDISRSALKIARFNSKLHKVRVHFKHGDLLKPFANKKFNIVIANLPYLTPEQLKETSISKEPTNALLAGNDGLKLYRRLFMDITNHLEPSATILLEIDPAQVSKIKKIAQTHLGAIDIKVLKDLQGLDRIFEIKI